MGRITQNYAVTRVNLGETVTVDTRADTVTVEEPLEIRVGGPTLTTTMRTPGNDIELVHGFLHGEGLINSATQVTTARYCAGATGPDGANTYNVLEVDLATGVRAPGLESLRLTTTTSACGVCGSTSIDQIMGKSAHPITPVELDPRLVVSLPEKLREGQKQFRKTGGIHAAGAFTLDGEPVVIREDIGRHNAADKVIGHLLLEDRLPAEDLILVMSSRASFELVQKAVMAGFPALVAVSAASSLAVELAREAGMALTGFTRENRFNLYSGKLRERS
ncbi:formate dehydrogenase accessory sulfurtransferase FdhD [Corynebacterium halotolerans]|uniref:Sulfur carrier protein FdhD n=1 Tax=Corynebacterium halotolerans YIM 70093 = DSM 44683 TaxID=1121362 RepID=M1NPW5_9CORY|nr:formate dehydrogenase accessory sulfurtransferase FdhD [Corynebacterium halotolerans]AGF71527.1 formate dehydrogenase accessory protein [Corynebacterium halotolerans YIM 70093 = DSM 44683]